MWKNNRGKEWETLCCSAVAKKELCSEYQSTSQEGGESTIEDEEKIFSLGIPKGYLFLFDKFVKFGRRQIRD